jgi:hypothetical protein
MFSGRVVYKSRGLPVILITLNTQHFTFPNRGFGGGGRGIFFVRRLHCLKIFRHTKKFCGCTISVSFNADISYEECRVVYVWSVFLPNFTYVTGSSVNAVKGKRYLCINCRVYHLTPRNINHLCKLIVVQLIKKSKDNNKFICFSQTQQ